MSEARKPFARVVPSDGRYYKVAGIIAKPSAPQDAEGDVRTINAAVERARRDAAARALRQAAAWVNDGEETSPAGIHRYLLLLASNIEGGAS